MERVGDEQAGDNDYEESYEEQDFMDNIKEKHA